MVICIKCHFFLKSFCIFCDCFPQENPSDIHSVLCAELGMHWFGFLSPNTDTDTNVELIINCTPVSEKYLQDGREYLGSKYSSRQWKPSSSTADIVDHLKHWILKLSVLLQMLSSFPSENFRVVEVHPPKLAAELCCLLLLWFGWAAVIRRAPQHGAFGRAWLNW